MATLTLGNGNGSTYEPDDLRTLPEGDAALLLEQVLSFVDDDLRESIHSDAAPCSNAHYLAELVGAIPSDLTLP